MMPAAIDPSFRGAAGDAPRPAPPGFAAGHERRTFFAILLMSVALVAIWTAAVLPVNQAAHTATEKATTQAVIAARVAEQLLLRTMDGVDSSLTLVSARHMAAMAGDGAGATIIAARLSDVVAAGRHGVLSIADHAPDGAVRWSSPEVVAPATPLPSGLRHRSLMIAPPQRDVATGRWTLRVSQPFRDEHGVVAGRASALVDSVALSGELARLAAGAPDLLFVLHRDGTPLARSDAATATPSPEEEEARGHSIVEMAEAQGGRPFRLVSPFDGRDRFFALRPVAGTPLLVVASIDAATALAPVRGILLLTLITAGVTSTLVVVLTLFARRQNEGRLTVLELHQARLAEATAGAARAEIEALLAGLPIVVYRATVRPGGVFEVAYASAAMAELPDPGAAAARATFLEQLLAGRDATVEYAVERGGRPSAWLREGARVVDIRAGDVEVVGYRADITLERQFAEQAAEASKLATLGEMATGLAHELNQPVTAMALGADNAADTLEAEGAAGIAEAIGTLRRVAGEASRTQTIIDHLRVFGRRDAGPVGPVDLARAVDGALVLAGSALRSAHVEVTCDIPQDLPPVQAQLVLLEQVLLNLFLNARDAMSDLPKDARRLDLVARRGATGRVELAVRDGGAGVPPEFVHRIFEPFFTTKPVGQGTGLGLALSHGMMAAMGGAIRFANLPGGGEFVLELATVPAASAAAEETPDIA